MIISTRFRQLPEDLLADGLLGLLSVIWPVSRPTRLTTIFTLSAIPFISLKDIISRTTFLRQGRSNWVTSSTWLAISRAAMPFEGGQAA